MNERGRKSPSTEPAESATHWTNRILTRADQTGVVVLSLLGILAMAAWWIGHGGCRGNLIEIERAEPLDAQYQIDINTAEWNELVQLPGIGPMYATRILESRRNEGPFTSHEDLLRVHGIGPKRLEQMRPYLAPMKEQGLGTGDYGDPHSSSQSSCAARRCLLPCASPVKNAPMPIPLMMVEPMIMEIGSAGVIRRAKNWGKRSRRFPKRGLPQRTRRTQRRKVVAFDRFWLIATAP